MVSDIFTFNDYYSAEMNEVPENNNFAVEI